LTEGDTIEIIAPSAAPINSEQIDEAKKLKSLMGLAEGRKYGGCVLAGFQSKPQLEDIYGGNSAEAMLDLFNTKLFFRCTELTTQSWISKVLGDKEEAAPQENISFGANSMRDGVSLSRHTRQKPLVMPAELSQLQDLEAYVKYPGDYPCTKIQSKFQRRWFLGLNLSKNEPFLLKPEKENKPAPQFQGDPEIQVQQEISPTTVQKEVE
jgi:type IV secretory pathway TraG/TraD family ATPase VirD4